MKSFWMLPGLLFIVACPSYAQNWTPQDSLRLHQMLQNEGPLELNPEALRELGVEDFSNRLLSGHEKSWLGFRYDLPSLPKEEKKKVILTLHPYAPNTRYDWDPVLQRKIKVDKNTWRGAFYDLKTRKYPSNWARNPLDAGDRSSLERIEATGLRYVVMERAGNRAVGEWRYVGSGGTGMSAGSGAGIHGLDLMTPFTGDFWNFKGRKRRKRTLEVLRTYAADTLLAK